jgi:hypothetical protein
MAPGRAAAAQPAGQEDERTKTKKKTKKTVRTAQLHSWFRTETINEIPGLLFGSSGFSQAEGHDQARQTEKSSHRPCFAVFLFFLFFLGTRVSGRTFLGLELQTRREEEGRLSMPRKI